MVRSGLKAQATSINPQISGRRVVWSGRDSNDFEISFYDIRTGTTTRLTNNGFDDKVPQISGRHIVWQGEKGWADNEIFHYDIGRGRKTHVTGNSDDDVNPQVSRKGIVWKSADENDDEIQFSPISNIWR